MNDFPKLNFNPYLLPIPSSRSGNIFRVHPYPTKIHYKSILPFILAHTKPGDVVYDCFAGTCSTGLAAASCSIPDKSVISEFGLPEDHIQWGARKAICIDIGVLPTFIGRTLVSPVDIDELEKTFNQFMDSIEDEWGWIYSAIDNDGKLSKLTNTVYSDVVACPSCSEQVTFYELFVKDSKSGFKKEGRCSTCGSSVTPRIVRRVVSNEYDPVLRERHKRVMRIPVLMHGKTGSSRWFRLPELDDLSRLEKISRIKFPESIKPIPMLSGNERWGDMYRSGYHQDISHVHHFYTRRNLVAVSALYERAKTAPTVLRDFLLLAISSYNAAHSTLMTRFVFKKGNPSPVNTSAQPGALYVSGCPVEKNVFMGVRNKFSELSKALIEVHKWRPEMNVYTRPAQQSGLPDASVDFIFTDPPFAGNIHYAEVNFISEAWLGRTTEMDQETIVSRTQQKGLEEYEQLLLEAFRENYRVLKPGRFMCVVFHSAKREVWNALRRAILDAGFSITDTSVLNKSQTSFKQTTTLGAVKKDPIIVAHRPESNGHFKHMKAPISAKDFIIERLTNGIPGNGIERTFDFLFSRYIGLRLATGNEVDLNADRFRNTLENVAFQRAGRWYTRRGSI